MCRVALILASLLLLTLPLFAADNPAASKYRIETLGQVDSTDLNNVTVRFRVVDERGEPAKDLPDEEFVIHEDGKEVHRFRPAGLRSQPLSAVLAMDTSGSMERQNRIQEAKRAAERFFDRLDDRTPCGLILFHHESWTMEPLNADKRRLRDLVEAARPGGGTAYLNATYDAVQLLAESSNRERRAVLLMTDGRDVNSKRNLEEVIREAKNRNVRIYTLGLGEPGLNFPVRTVLVLDRSGSMADRGKMEALKNAARRFVHLMPKESADTTIIAFHHSIPMAAPFTAKKDRLLRQIDELFPLGGTALYDAIYEGLETLNAGRDVDGRKPRRSLVVLTDGKDENSRRSAREVIRRAQKDEIRVHLMGLGLLEDIDEPVMKEIASATGGSYFHVPDAGRLTDVFEELSITLHDDGVDEASLRRLAEQTGGEYYHVRDADKLSSVFERVASQLENTYAVTFASRRARFDGTARQIDIRFGDLAGASEAYTTHGLITPMGNPRVYLGLLATLAVLVIVPSVFRRRPRMAS
jgi:VWFA-related protein